MTSLRRTFAAAGLALSLAALSILAAAPLAHANSPITSFTDFPSTTQAGGHPDLRTEFKFLSRFEQIVPPDGCHCQDAETLAVHLPPGFVGDPHALPICTLADFGTNHCPSDSQVGISTFGLGLVPVFNLEPHPGQAGLLGLTVPAANFPIFQVLSSRTGGDYGLDDTVVGLFHLFPLNHIYQLLWGVPGASSHDPLRFPRGDTVCYGSYLEGSASSLNWTDLQSHDCGGGTVSPPPTPFNSPVRPFLENPTTCGVPLTSSLDILSYDGGTSHADAPWPPTTGCDQLSFNPSLFVQPTTQQTDSASGSDVDLQVPQQTSPSVPAPSEIRSLTVELPPGFTLTPNASDGKVSCSDAQASFGTENPAHCPEFSKIGTLTLTSSLLPGPLSGAIYIGDPKPGDPYRLILTADGFDVHVKLAGSALPNPQTGQLTLSFQNLPQTPFEDFNLHFFGSERGLLVTPTQCGTYPVKATFTPWDSTLPEQRSTQFFVLDSGPNGQPCPAPQRPFDPSFQAGVADSTAGAHSPFTLTLIRNDGDQNLSALDVTTPPGFSATLAGIPYCPDPAIAATSAPGYSGLAEQSSPRCPTASQIGTSITGIGAGTHPVYFPGRVYLAGPYRGAPLSLAVITPALSGPFDLGNVVVRAALHVDPTTAQITAASDSLPQILQGIPLRLRSLRIDLGRKNFVLNPTNCNPFSVNATITGDQGAIASLSEHFQASNCAVLPFAPELTTKFTGPTKRAGNPALKAVLTYPQGGSYANVASTSVTLPPTESIDNAHINNPCTRVVFAEGSTPGEKCPPGSVIGFAKAETPLLEKPLEGPVYLRSSSHKLPDIVAALNGQIDIVLDGRVDTVHKSIRTTFETVPDAPVSKFTLSLDGGRKGLLQNNTNLCKASLHTVAKIAAQNGLSANQNPLLQTPCGKSSRRKLVRLARAQSAPRGEHR